MLQHVLQSALGHVLKFDGTAPQPGAWDDAWTMHVDIWLEESVDSLFLFDVGAVGEDDGGAVICVDDRHFADRVGPADDHGVVAYADDRGELDWMACVIQQEVSVIHLVVPVGSSDERAIDMDAGSVRE